MKQRQFGTTGVRVSEFALGTMTFGREIDEADSAGILDAYLDVGGTFIDTADVYGEGASEEILSGSGLSLVSATEHSGGFGESIALRVRQRSLCRSWGRRLRGPPPTPQ